MSCCKLKPKRLIRLHFQEFGFYVNSRTKSFSKPDLRHRLYATTRNYNNYNNYHITVLICVVLHKSIYNIRFSDDDDDDDDDEDDYD